MGSKQLVLAFFASEAAADAAVEAIKQWDKASKEIKLGSIGVIVKDEKGKVKTHKLGKRSTATGALLGALVAILPAVGLLAGVVGGGVLGAFFRKGLGMSKDDLARIGAELDGGKAAVGILASADEAAAVAAKLAELGGVAERHEVSAEAEDHVADAAEAAQVDPDPAPEAEPQAELESETGAEEKPVAAPGA